MADGLTYETAWLSMAAAAATAVCWMRPAPRPAESRTARLFWTAGCSLLWIHVACAFQFQHRWSHPAAYQHTAARTADFIGLNWGGGLYFNYAVMLVWAADVAWWWIAPQRYRDRPAFTNWLVRGFVAFMAINATIVFGTGIARWIAAAVTLTLGLAAGILRRR